MGFLPSVGKAELEAYSLRTVNLPQLVNKRLSAPAREMRHFDNTGDQQAIDQNGIEPDPVDSISNEQKVQNLIFRMAKGNFDGEKCSFP
jgi:hypothetical protein